MGWQEKLQGKEWSGKGELWRDPEGNNPDYYECTMRVETNALHYTWQHEDETKEGSFSFAGGEVVWIDSWHQRELVKCEPVPGAWGMFTVFSFYNQDWGWRCKLSERPNGDLVLQMTNIAPWGEEARAVRMVFSSAE